MRRASHLLAISLVALLAAFACGNGDEATETSDATEPDVPAPTAKPKPKSYDGPPPMTIDPAKTYLATIVMEEGGEIVIELFAEETPITVNNFVFLARDGYYDGVTFHRVIEGFMAQAGDPTGSGSGGPGYTFEDEFHPDRTHKGPGVLSMANRGPNTNGSQFFITYGATPHLDFAHSVFGQVTAGMEVVEGLAVRSPGDSTPADVIKTIRIIED